VYLSLIKLQSMNLWNCPWLMVRVFVFFRWKIAYRKRIKRESKRRNVSLAKEQGDFTALAWTRHIFFGRVESHLSAYRRATTGMGEEGCGCSKPQGIYRVPLLPIQHPPSPLLPCTHGRRLSSHRLHRRMYHCTDTSAPSTSTCKHAQ